MRRELHRLTVRKAGTADFPIWAKMLARLHGGTPAEFEAELAQLTSLPDPYVCFLAWDDGERPVGMVDARVRNYAEGAPNLRAAYVEDLWVDPEHRRRGVAKALLAAVEQWAADQGLDWLGSDAQEHNRLSRSWHAAAGFEEIESLVIFGKPIARR